MIASHSTNQKGLEEGGHQLSPEPDVGSRPSTTLEPCYRVPGPVPPSGIRPLENSGRGTTKTGPCFPRKKRQTQRHHLIPGCPCPSDFMFRNGKMMVYGCVLE